MALNGAGDRLFLMVVDGRQPGYSEGMSLDNTGRLLKLFGATDGMSCDEGGSSVMYLKNRGGLVNRPSDRQERPIHTHFGVSFRR